MMTYVDCLKKVPLFSELDEGELHQLASVVREQHYRKHTTIVHVDDPGSALYILKSGLVKITIEDQHGDEMILRILYPMDFFGEMSLLDGMPRSATVTAQEPSEVLTIAREHFLSIIEPSPKIVLKMTTVLSRRLRKANELIHSRDMVLIAAKEKAEAANKELEAFSYSVSHDLRAPLRSIDGFSQALLEDYAGSLDATGQDYLRRVRAAAVRMGELIEDLLNLSRITRSDMRTDKVDLSHLTRAIAEVLQHTQPERQVEFVIAEGLVAQGDPRLLRVALENLLSNAWKFTSKRPQARIEFGAAQEDGQQAYFVRDNGAGFDMAYAAKLFGAFQRLHSSVEFPGTGIGLATVQRIIHRHGGRVWAQGAVGEGATFYFTLAGNEGPP